jgi:hypothetical protein
LSGKQFNRSKNERVVIPRVVVVIPKARLGKKCKKRKKQGVVITQKHSIFQAIILKTLLIKAFYRRY